MFSNLLRRTYGLITLLLCLNPALPNSHATIIETQGDTYYVAVNGVDTVNNGTLSNPWATISYAVTRVPDAGTILVKPGTYVGQVQLDRAFDRGITVRSEVPYRARLRNNDIVVRSFRGKRIAFEGFDIAHSGAASGSLVIQIQDRIGEPGGVDLVSHITLRNNIIHDSYNNDLLKINNGAGQINVIGNMFYNQSGSDEHIDVNSVTDTVIEGNIFFNDFLGSGRTNSNNTSSFIVIKDSNASEDTNLGSQRITVRRNIFLKWEGSRVYGFLRVGEDATVYYEALDVLIENNLFLGDSAAKMNAPFQVMGSRDIVFRHNTVVGDFTSDAFAMNLYTSGENQPNLNIQFYNNIWSDPTGSMTNFSNTPQNMTASFILINNLYWNNGQPIPADSTQIVNYTADIARVLADPRLNNQRDILPPRWNDRAGEFIDGSTSIEDAFERLVAQYGSLGEQSGAIDRANPAQSPTQDILGNQRPIGAATDIGAYERQTNAPVSKVYLPLVRRVDRQSAGAAQVGL